MCSVGGSEHYTKEHLQSGTSTKDHGGLKWLFLCWIGDGMSLKLIPVFQMLLYYEKKKLYNPVITSKWEFL